MKTPIQELIDKIKISNKTSDLLMSPDAKILGKVFEQMLIETLQKEKLFASDCYDEGYNNGVSEKFSAFDKFYLKYTK